MSAYAVSLIQLQVFQKRFSSANRFICMGRALQGCSVRRKKAKLCLESFRLVSKGSSQAGDFSVPGFPGLLQHRCDVLIFFTFVPPSTFVLPVNNFTRTCDCLVLLLQSPLHLQAVLASGFCFWHRFRPATVVSAALYLLGSLPLFLDVCRCSCFPSLFFVVENTRVH